MCPRKRKGFDRDPLPFPSGRTYSQKDFVKLLDDAIASYGEHRAMVYVYNSGDRVDFTYSDVMDHVLETVAEMGRRGIAPGDRIAIVAPTSPFYVILALSMSYMGVTAALIDGSLGASDVDSLLEKVDPCAVFSTGRLFSSMGGAVLEGKVLFSVGDGGRTITHVPGSPESVSASTLDGDGDVSIIIFSSGTTGGMKGAEITYNSLLRAMNVDYKIVGLDGVPGLINYFYVLPLNHVAGYVSAFVAFFCGAELDFVEDVGPSKYLEGLKTFEPTHFLTVPAVYDIMEQKTLEALRNKSRLVYRMFTAATRYTGFIRRNTGVKAGKRLFKGIYSKLLGRNITTIVTGASPCKNSTARFITSMGLEWINFYATTETNIPIAAIAASDRLKYGYSGTVNTVDGIEVRIRNIDSDGIGEIQVRTELIMKRYFKDPAATEAAFDDGWFRTGDSGYIDNKSRLHIVGRIKESIVLRSGKKVSPVDVDDYYIGCLGGGCEIASCGVPTEEDCDEIHLFAVRGGMTDRGLEELEKRIMEASASAPPMYHVSEVHFVDSIPKTSVGKVMRFALKESALSEKKAEIPVVQLDSSLTVESLYAMIRKYRPGAEIRPDSRLVDGIGLDSISLFNIKCDLESIYGIDFGNGFGSAVTVADLWDAVCGNTPAEPSESEDLSMYPSPRGERTGKSLRRWARLLSSPYRFEVSGSENIPQDGSNYIICANHASYLDPFWILKAAKGRIDYSRVSCMSAKERMDGGMEKKLFNAIGAIPVDRFGDALPSTKRARECLVDEKYIMFIFPEGARSRDGSMLPFKAGAAELAMKTGKKILPVRLEGSFEIFPRHKKRPKTFRLGRRRRLRVTFGEMIDPAGHDDSIELTQMLKDRISGL